MNILKMQNCKPFVELLYTAFNIKIWENVTYKKVTRPAQAIVSFLGGYNMFLCDTSPDRMVIRY